MTKREDQLRQYAAEYRISPEANEQALEDATLSVQGVSVTASLSWEERRAILNGMYAMEEDAAINRSFNTGVAEAASAHAAILRALLKRLK